MDKDKLMSNILADRVDRASPFFQVNDQTTNYRFLGLEGLKLSTPANRSRRFLSVSADAISELIKTAFGDVSHLFRTAHLEQLRAIYDDPEASANDRFVALELLKNAAISAQGLFPSCQDTGTAIVWGKKGENVLVEGDLHHAICQGILQTWQTRNLRFSQMAPLTMFQEKNTGTNLPAQI